MSSGGGTRWIQGLVNKTLVGQKLTLIEMIAPGTWEFRFGEVHCNVGSPWRIIGAQGIMLGSCDHSQKFGLPAPVDAAQLAFEMLGGVPIENVEITQRTSDLRIQVQGGFVLEVLNYSSGYEGWNVSSADGQVIALGGGELAVSGRYTMRS